MITFHSRLFSRFGKLTFATLRQRDVTGWQPAEQRGPEPLWWRRSSTLCRWPSLRIFTHQSHVLCVLGGRTQFKGGDKFSICYRLPPPPWNEAALRICRYDAVYVLVLSNKYTWIWQLDHLYEVIKSAVPKLQSNVTIVYLRCMTENSTKLLFKYWPAKAPGLCNIMLLLLLWSPLSRCIID